MQTSWTWLGLVNVIKTLRLLILNLNTRLLKFPNYQLVTLWASLIKGDNPWNTFIEYGHNPWASLIMSW